MTVVWRDATLTCLDQVKLISRLWYPQGEGPWPTLLMRQPYGRAIASTVTYAHPSWWAANGYLVVIQDVRGQGNSEGSFSGFGQEAADTAETHLWVRQLPECNGRLGTYGFSYQGLTQLLATPGTPPPDCLAPAMTGLDEADHWSSEGGAQWWHINLAWGLQLAALQAGRRGDSATWERLRRALDDGSYLWEGASLLKKHDPQGICLQWLRMGRPLPSELPTAERPTADLNTAKLNTAELKSAERKPHGRNNAKLTIHTPLKSWLRQPMLLLGGWWDPHLKGILDLHQRSEQAGGSPELHIGPATHLQWWPEAQKLQLNFFNRHLKSTDHVGQAQPKTRLTKPRLWNLTRDCWQESSTEGEGRRSLFSGWSLFSAGLACLDSNEGSLRPRGEGGGVLTLVHDPWRPVPSIGGHLSPQPGAADRSGIDLRSDVATFTSAPLQQSMTLEGIPALRIQVHSDQAGFDLCAAVSILKEGRHRTEQLSTGVLRLQGEDARTPRDRRVMFQPLLAELAAGDRLRLSLAGSCWPAIGINPGHSLDICGPPTADCRVITLTMDLADSSLQLLPLAFGKMASDSPQEP